MAAGVSLKEPPYTRAILRLASSIPHQVDFASLADAVEQRSRTCGSRVRVSVSMDRERVACIRQAVEACAYGQAAAALMGGWAVGLNREEASAMKVAVERFLNGDDDPLVGWPDLGVLSPAIDRPSRREAILLPFRALVAAIDEAGK